MRRVLANRATWPGFFVNLGIGGSFLAFAGLWAVPFLVDTYGMSRVVAAQHASALLLGVAIGAVVIGMLSDQLGSRRAVMRICAWLYALSWLPWLLGVHWPLPATLAWFALMGLLIPGFTLTWTVAKEVNRPEHSGMATSVVNVGIFLGTGILQPLGGMGARSRAGAGRSCRRLAHRNMDPCGRHAVRRGDDGVRPRGPAPPVTSAAFRSNATIAKGTPATPPTHASRDSAARRSACDIRARTSSSCETASHCDVGDGSAVLAQRDARTIEPHVAHVRDRRHAAEIDEGLFQRPQAHAALRRQFIHAEASANGPG